MCIALVKKPNSKSLTKEVMRRCFERNPHGAGFAFAVDNKLIASKGYFDFELFWTNFNSIQNKGTVMAHFRKASAGIINEENCHPFRIDKNHAIVHNGTLYEFINPESQLSDTGLYTNLVLKPLFRKDKDFWKSKVGHYLLAKTMGWSKMIILSNKGEFTILNEGEGVWDGDCWFSNDGFLDESSYCGTLFPRQLSLELDFPLDETETTENEEEELAEMIT